MTTVWMEAALGVFGVIMLSGAAALAAQLWQRRTRFGWMGSYVTGLFLIGLVGLSYWFRHLQFVPPFSWAVEGRREFALCGPAAALLFTTMLARLGTRRERAAVVLFGIIVVGRFSLWPFLAPAFSYAQLAGCTTRINGEGVCMQTLDYTCGPAAAVTALRHFGLPGDEGEIGISSRASAGFGTLPDLLCDALQPKLRLHGLRAEYRAFDSLAELASVQGCVIAIVKFAFYVDHYVTVLDVGPQFVIVADPARGREELPHEEFQRRWRFVGIVVDREGRSVECRMSNDECRMNPFFNREWTRMDAKR